MSQNRLALHAMQHIQIQSFLNQSISVRIRPEHELLFLSPLRIHLFSTPIEALAIEHEIRGFRGSTYLGEFGDGAGFVWV